MAGAPLSAIYIAGASNRFIDYDIILVQMERIGSTNADRIAWCCQQFGITPYEPATEVGISEQTMDRAMASEAALTFAQKGLDARWAQVI